MDLQHFIKESIVQISKGIIDANKEVMEHGGAVNPRDVTFNKSGEGPYGYYAEDQKNSFRRAIEKIDFDVVVSVAQGTETEGGIGLKVGSFGLGSSGKTEKENTSESRIKFSLPILLPVAEQK